MLGLALATPLLSACGGDADGVGRPADDPAAQSSPSVGSPRLAVTPSPTATALPEPTAVPGPEVRFDLVTVRVEVARTMAERTRGLGGHAPLGPREGMLFFFEQSGIHSFWMKGMSFALDILWIADNEVVFVRANVPPPAPGTPASALPVYTPPVPATHVLEVPAGFAARWDIAPGARLAVHGLPASALTSPQAGS